MYLSSLIRSTANRKTASSSSSPSANRPPVIHWLTTKSIRNTLNHIVPIRTTGGKVNDLRTSNSIKQLTSKRCLTKFDFIFIMITYTRYVSLFDTSINKLFHEEKTNSLTSNN